MARRGRHTKSAVARAEADAPRRKVLKIETVVEPEWKDTDPPFMRAIYERDAPPVEPTRSQRKRADPEAMDARHAKRKVYSYKSHAARRARMAGAEVGEVNRARVIARDDSTCYLCGKRCEEKEIHLDHIIPLANGGPHTEENLGVTCAPCNLRKHVAPTTMRPPALG